MRRSSLVAVVMCCVIATLVATAAAGPPGATPPTKKSNAPAGATLVSSLALLLGSLVVYTGAFPSCYDRDCSTDEKQMAVGGAILVVAPTLVRLPAREIGGVHLGIRFAGAAIIAASAMSYSDDEAPYLIGAGLIFAGAISDVVTVHGAYRRWNERHAVGVVPATVTQSGGLSPGLTLGGRF